MAMRDDRPPEGHIYELTLLDPMADALDPFVARVVVRVVALSEGHARRSAETALVHPSVKDIPDGAFLDPEAVTCEVVGPAELEAEVGTVSVCGRRPDWISRWPHRLRGSSSLH